MKRFVVFTAIFRYETECINHNTNECDDKWDSNNKIYILNVKHKFPLHIRIQTLTAAVWPWAGLRYNKRLLHEPVDISMRYIQ